MAYANQRVIHSDRTGGDFTVLRWKCAVSGIHDLQLNAIVFLLIPVLPTMGMSQTIENNSIKIQLDSFLKHALHFEFENYLRSVTLFRDFMDTHKKLKKCKQIKTLWKRCFRISHVKKVWKMLVKIIKTDLKFHQRVCNIK